MEIIEELDNGEEIPISTIKSEHGTIQLYITEHTPEDDIDWDDEITLLTKCYEFAVSDATIEYDLTHNIARDDGWVFKVNTPDNMDTCEARFISILTDRGPDGEIIVPDEPYDKGYFELNDGVYRLFEKRTPA